MNWLQDLAKSYYNGLSAEKYGVDWREKRAATEASTAATQAQTRQTEAQTKTLLPAQVKTSEANAANITANTEATRQDMAFKRKQVDELERMVREGKIPSTNLDAVKEVISRARLELDQQAAPSEIKLREAQTGYYNRMPNQGANGGMGKPRLVKSGTSYKWVYPGQSDGTSVNVFNPTNTQLETSGHMSDFMTDATALNNLYNHPQPGHEIRQGWGGSARRAVKNVPVLGGAVNSQEELLADYKTKQALMDRVYSLSGKQINETEFQRLMDLMPDRGNQDEVNKVNSAEFYALAKRVSDRWNRLLATGMTEEQAQMFVQNDQSLSHPATPTGARPGAAPAPAAPATSGNPGAPAVYQYDAQGRRVN